MLMRRSSLAGLAALVGLLQACFNMFSLGQNAAPSPYKVEVKDVTGDGEPELLVAFYRAGVVAVETIQEKGESFSLLALNPVCDQLGAGDPSYQGGALNLDLGDVDRDGLPDLLVGCGGHFAALARNLGSGRFEPVMKLPTRGTGKGVHLSDLDGDGWIDLLYAGRGVDEQDQAGGRLHLRRNLGGWRFGGELVLEAGKSAYYVLTSDLDEDGRPDILVPNERDRTVTYWLNPGGRLFESVAGWRPRLLTTSGFKVNDLRTADFNGDGHLDLVTANWVSSTISYFPGKGEGTFGRETAFEGGKDCTFLAVADFEPDGDQDFVVTHWRSDFISVFLNDGRGSFRRQDYGAGQGNYGVVCADLNEDGKVDLITANYQDESLSLLWGRGEGRFEEARRLTRRLEKDASGAWHYPAEGGTVAGADGREANR